jgi:hypothetical protein
VSWQARAYQGSWERLSVQFSLFAEEGEGVKFLIGVRQEMGEILDATAVFDPTDPAVKRQCPIFSLFVEQILWRTLRSRCGLL